MDFVNPGWHAEEYLPKVCHQTGGALWICSYWQWDWLPAFYSPEVFWPGESINSVTKYSRKNCTYIVEVYVVECKPYPQEYFQLELLHQLEFWKRGLPVQPNLSLVASLISSTLVWMMCLWLIWIKYTNTFWILKLEC